MRWLLLAVALASGCSHAANLAYSGNQAGGYVMLTDIKCSTGGKIAEAYRGNGRLEMIGCWWAATPFIYVEWANGENRSYRQDKFIVGDWK